MDNKLILDELSRERLELGAIRSLLEDERFKRYIGSVRARYKATDSFIDSLDPTDPVAIAEIKGGRKTYQHELMIVDNCIQRINVIDETLAEMKKERQHKKGNDGGRGTSTPPEER